jgi:tetratricopeptide (TPR) repeat protein
MKNGGHIWLIALVAGLLAVPTASFGVDVSGCASSTYSERPSSVPHNFVQEAGSITLKPGQTIKSDIRGGGTQSISFELPAGQFGQLIVQWQGMDLDVSIRKPDQSLLFPTSIPVRGTGPIPIVVIGEQTGTYSLEVRSTEQVNIPGKFEIVFSDLRFPHDADLNRFKALALVTQAQAEKAKPAAIEKYTKALELWQSAGDPLGRAYTLQRLANAYLASKDSQNAEKYYHALLELREALSDPQSLIYTRREIGQDFRAFVSPTKAIEYYQPALNLARETRNRRAEAALLYSIGFANQVIGYMNEALKAYDEARRIQHEDLDRLSEARTLNAMGGAYSALGDQQTALTYLQQAMAVFIELGDLYRVGIALNNIGLAYDDLGDLQNARDKYLEALAKFKSLLHDDLSVCKQGASAQTLAVCNSIANTSDNIGELFNTTGDPQSALEVFQQSLPLRQSLEQPRPIGLTLTRIGYSYVLQRQPLKAIEYCEQALVFNKKGEDLRNLAYSLTILGMAYAALNKGDIALDYFEQALSVQRQTQERRSEGITLNQLGSLYVTVGNYAKALDVFNLALRLWRDVKDQDGETITLFNIAKLERDRGNFDVAHKHIQQAISIVENRRATLNSQRLLATYFASKQDYYDLAIDVEMNLAKAGNTSLVASALEANERARGRRLLDALAEAKIIRTQDLSSITSQNPALKAAVEQQQSLALRLSAKANARTALLAGSHTTAD